MNDDKPQGQYKPSEIEPKWQAYWEEHKTFHVGNPGDDGFDARKPKYYVLDMFPYTSGSGLHVGHPEGYTATDILSRYKRMRGFNVLHPIGWDSFGLPAEQYAVQTNVHPRVTTEDAIKNFKRQLKRFGFSYDWDRELATTDLQYYKWTQWIFLKLFNSWFDDTAAKARPIDELIAELESGKWRVDADLQIVLPAPPPSGGGPSEPGAQATGHARSWPELSATEQRKVLHNQRLAFMDEVPVNWCPMLGTVLSNEEVTNDGRSDRGDHPVYRKPLKQWLLRITKYCERLTGDIETVDWPESIKAMQRNWVGRSEGAQVRFNLAKPVEGKDSVIEVFTTRPDTLFGATYMVLAPEHPLVEKIIPADWPPDTPETWKNPPSRGLQPTRTPDRGGPTTDAKIWLLTWTTYGTWLPGDPRGFVGRVPHDKHGHTVHNIPGELYDAEDAQLLSDSVKQMKGEPVFLRSEQAAALDRILNDVAACHSLHLIAYSVMKDHVHVLCRADQPSEELLQLFKGNASRQLSKQFGKPQERWWTRSGSRRLIKGEPDAACSYVLHQANMLASGSSQGGRDAHDSTSAGAEAPGSGGESGRVGVAHRRASAGAEAPGSGWTPRRAVMSYVEQARNKSDLDRTADTKEKTGVFTGAYAINPVNDEGIPIWVADYVLMGYGTGAIMAVPAHDKRDHEFANQYRLEIRQVVDGGYVAEFQTKDVKLFDPEADLICKFGIYRAEMSVGSHQGPVVRYFCTTQENAELCLEAIKSKCLHPGSVSRHEVVLPHASAGVSVNSGEFNGLATHEFKPRVISRLQERSAGRATVNYKLRDWLFSRQRYWGEPFPILHGPSGEIVALDESELPLDLPHMDNFKPDASEDPNAPPRPPLGRAKEWTRVDAYLTPQGNAVTLKNDQRAVGFSPRGRETGENVAQVQASAGAEAPGSERALSPARTYTRELNTMPQWAGSCWYYLRYISPTSDNEPWNGEAEKYWMNVDQYVGGAEHAVLHLLYARFWHKVLYDLGYVSTAEPFQKLFNQGLIQSFAYKDKRGMTLATDLVEEREEGRFYHKETGEPVEQIVAKMSKALKNVVNPDIILDEFGADTFRLYEMYMGPLDAAKPWNTRDIPGLSRFLARVWRLIIDEQTDELSAAVQDVEADEKSLRLLHKMIQKVGLDIEEFKLNTAIAEMIALTNVLTSAKVRSKKLLEQFVLVLAPFAPHLCEELWQRLGHGETLAYEPWPTYDPELARDTEIEVPVQINGKVRARIMLPADADQETMDAAAMADETIMKLLEGKTIRKKIVVPGKLVNIVAS